MLLSQRSGDDSLRAYHFGDFADNGWFLLQEEHDELHLRVAHLSVKEVRQGKKRWTVGDYVLRALEKSLLFIEFLLKHSDTPKDRINELRSKAELMHHTVVALNAKARSKSE